MSMCRRLLRKMSMRSQRVVHQAYLIMLMFSHWIISLKYTVARDQQTGHKKRLDGRKQNCP